MAETKKAGLRALLDELGLNGRPLTSQDVAIRFAPKLNALSRMEAGLLPVDIMLMEDHAKAQSMVAEILQNNSTRVQLQSEAENEAMELLKAWPHSDFVFVVSPNFHRGVVGLIATKLTQTFNKPAFVGSLGEDGLIVGSARMPNGVEACLVQAMSRAEDLLNRFGGHSAAAGFELAEGKVSEVIKRLVMHFEEIKHQPKPVEFEYDVEASMADVHPNVMKWYDFVGPFGTGFVTPLLRFVDLELSSVREMKGGHLRLKFKDMTQQGSIVEALLFSPTPRQAQMATMQGLRFDILGELQWNYFAGQKTIQVLVKDLKLKE